MLIIKQERESVLKDAQENTMQMETQTEPMIAMATITLKVVLDTANNPIPMRIGS